MSAQPNVDSARTQRPLPSGGRVSVYFSIRYLTPVLVLLAVAASTTHPNLDRLTGLLTAQIAFAVATHALAARGQSFVGPAILVGMITDVLAITGMVAITGGANGPLVFLYTLSALAAGILLSSRAGFRVIILSTIAIVVMDAMTHTHTFGKTTFFPGGLAAVAALWIIGGAGTMFSIYNERELKRRNAELATIRQVTLDIEDSLTLEEIFGDLCRGVVQGFRFDAAAVLLWDGEMMRVAASQGTTGSSDMRLDLRGRIASALRLKDALVTSRDEATSDGALIPLLGPRGYLAIPIAEDGLLIVTRDGRRGRPGMLRENEVEALDRLAHHARLAIANARLHAHVSEMAITDPLTGLANHGEMQARLAFESGRLGRYATLRAAGHHLSMILLDIDHFKKFNDRFGHQAGDAVLKGVAAAMKGAVRSFDIAARYGGEEFAVILPETTQEAAREVAERIRRSVAMYPFASEDGKSVRVTVSVGVATAPENGSTPAALIKQADTALYHSKEEGRNRVTHALDTEVPVARVLTMDATRRRREQGAARARAGARRAPARSSHPKRRTPPV
jgi:two-component system cell cycle response regulator